MWIVTALAASRGLVAGASVKPARRAGFDPNAVREGRADHRGRGELAPVMAAKVALSQHVKFTPRMGPE